MKLSKLGIELLFALLCVVKIKGETDWTYDILEVYCINRTPDKLDIKIYLKRVSRGYFVMDGTVNIGEDATDETIVYANSFYSPTGQYYIRTPFEIQRMPLSEFMNTFYKDFLMEGFKNCATNAEFMDSSGKFISPLTKRLVMLENCTFPNENMPSHLQSGYYNLTLVFTNQSDTTCNALAKAEPK
ncbi:hypothetical protein DOY81_001889 [Sarcophaga bullata]|nr:hypothetical protein DOY81_001889 [Sarcophaga bullata]